MVDPVTHTHHVFGNLPLCIIWHQIPSKFPSLEKLFFISVQESNAFMSSVLTCNMK